MAIRRSLNPVRVVRQAAQSLYDAGFSPRVTRLPAHEEIASRCKYRKKLAQCRVTKVLPDCTAGVGIAVGGRSGGNFGSDASGPKSGVLCRHRVLAGISRGVWVPETRVPATGSETQPKRNPRNAAGRRGLLHGLAATAAAQTIRALRAGVASSGMELGRSRSGGRSLFRVARGRRLSPFGQTMGVGRAAGGGSQAHSGWALWFREESHLSGHVWDVLGYRLGLDAVDSTAGC